MIGHSDDAKIGELLAPLRRLEPVALREREGRRLRWRPLLVVAVVTLGLAGAGVAIAAGVGAFNGISAAQGPQTPAALRWAKGFQSRCPRDTSGTPAYLPQCHLVLASARLLSAGSRVYVVADTHGDLCFSFSFGEACGSPLSRSLPITMGVANTGPIPPGGTLTVGGVAIDGVTSVSFDIWGRNVAVPVKHNTYVYVRHHSTAHGARCVVAHFANGSTVHPFPEDSCP